MAGFVFRSKAMRRGFTLTELAIVMGVVGAIIGIIWATSSMVSQQRKVNRGEQQIATIVQAMRALYANNPIIAAANNNMTANMANAGVFPADMMSGTTIAGCVGTSPAANPWGGATSIWSDGNNVSATSFHVAFYGVPPDACVQLISNVASNYTSSGPTKYITQGGAHTTPIPTTGLDPSTIIGDCEGNNVKTACGSSVEFDFNLQ